MSCIMIRIYKRFPATDFFPAQWEAASCPSRTIHSPIFATWTPLATRSVTGHASNSDCAVR